MTLSWEVPCCMWVMLNLTYIESIVLPEIFYQLFILDFFLHMLVNFLLLVSHVAGCSFRCWPWIRNWNLFGFLCQGNYIMCCLMSFMDSTLALFFKNGKLHTQQVLNPQPHPLVFQGPVDSVGGLSLKLQVIVFF